MAYLTHSNGEQLTQTKAKALANFNEVVADRAEIDAAELILNFGGMGLPAFRDACRANFVKINTDVAGLTLEVIDDGDMLWSVRDKLNVNFGEIDAAA